MDDPAARKSSISDTQNARASDAGFRETDGGVNGDPGEERVH